MLSRFVRDLQDEDDPVYEAFAERPDRPMRIRLQPNLLRGSRLHKLGNQYYAQYRAWKDVRWILECETPEEVLAVRDAMKVFFTTVAAIGPEETVARLVTDSRRNTQKQQEQTDGSRNSDPGDPHGHAAQRGE